MRLTFHPVDGAAELPGPDEAGEFAEAIAGVAAQERVAPWCSYIVRDEGRAAGFGGFKYAPDENGETEIGYLTFASRTGNGIASAFAAWLVATARAEGAKSVCAHTLPEANASTRVLEKAGLVRDGWGEDEDVGRVWRWRLAF